MSCDIPHSPDIAKMHWKEFGAENMWLAAGVYGPTVHHNSIINGDHYSRSPDAQKSLAESMQRLLFNEFFGTASGNVSDS